jgi:hypothetical protein
VRCVGIGWMCGGGIVGSAMSGRAKISHGSCSGEVSGWGLSVGIEIMRLSGHCGSGFGS